MIGRPEQEQLGQQAAIARAAVARFFCAALELLPLAVELLLGLREPLILLIELAGQCLGVAALEQLRVGQQLIELAERRRDGACAQLAGLELLAEPNRFASQLEHARFTSFAAERRLLGTAGDAQRVAFRDADIVRAVAGRLLQRAQIRAGRDQPHLGELARFVAQPLAGRF